VGGLLAFALSPLFAQVRLETDLYEGAEHFVVRTASATYWYDKAGGGLSRLIDREGHDWIAFRREPWGRTPESAASAYRGVPNFAFGAAESGAGHPGFPHCVSVAWGNRILTTSRSGAWRWIWTFHETHAQVTVERAGPGGYWFLYEGVPGGKYDPASWYWGYDGGGPLERMPDFLKGEREIGQFRWAYFGHRGVKRVLLLAQHESDGLPDSFGVMGNSRAGLASSNGMVVFGFGRAKEAKPLIEQVPRTFSIGFVESHAADAAGHQIIAREAQRRLSEPGLAVRIWYGKRQRFGDPGVPQRWVNLLGTVEGPARRLRFSLNGGLWKEVSLGPNDTRLAARGDFNIEIDVRALRAGANLVAIEAEGANGQTANETVEVEFIPNRFWPLPYEADWSRAREISEVAQVVDGEWAITESGVRTVRPYYDRVLAIGDLNWRDYEATVEVTFHAFTEPKPGPPTYGVSHAGLGLRWQGHQDDGEQPRVQWYPLGAATEFQLFPDLAQSHWRILPGRDSGKTVYARERFPLELNRRYLLKARVERQPAGRTRYGVKIWPAGDAEPAAWAAENVEGASDLQHGSLLLVAHNTDVTFGRVQITSPGPVAPWQEEFREPDRKARLGETHYSALVGGTVGSSGHKFICELLGERGRILSAQAGLTPNGSIVQALRFEIEDSVGKRSEKICGPGSGVIWAAPFAIPPNRRLVGISGASGWMIDSVRFHLDDGSASPRYGGEGGDTTFRLQLNQDAAGRWKGELRGFWGTAGGALESLGLVFWPIE
jgi:hypothetical protein